MARQLGKFRSSKHNMDYILLTVVLFLVGFGLLMIYSASSYEAGIEYNDSGFYLKKQAQSTMIGFVGLFVMIKFPYKELQRFDVIAIVVSAVLIMLVKTPIGITRNGASRWINLGFTTLQPAEVAKIGVIVYLASIIQRLESLGKNIIRTPKGLAIVLAPPTVIAGLIYGLTNNLSSAVIVMGIAVAMLFVAVPDYKWFVIIGASGAAAVTALVLYVSGADTSSATFRLARVKAWLDPESFSTDKAFQTLQALYAIGSGGIWGKGLGLIWSCMVIANKTMDRFGALLVVGVMAHYAIQVILNIAVVTNTIPNTGITLPFISYGGTSSLFLLMEIGIVLNVSKHCR